MAKTNRRTRSAAANTLATAAQPPASTPIADEPLVSPLDEIPVDAGGAARILGTPKSWVYTKAELGEIPSYKIGHYRRFLPSELREYLRKCRTASPA